MSRIKHIDGLRAISILSVVFYHTFPSTFPNGYLGVDYFLVISGFVISKKYFIEPKQQFSMGEFFSKRISRLYPQLLACIALCTPIAWLTMSPDYLDDFGQSAIATLFGANNILLYLTGGYRNLINEFQPLYNTWSLGLEEQFYFLVAITFVISYKCFKTETLQKVFLILFILSCTASGFGSLYFKTANYLLLPTRFWEFLIGIYAAYLARQKPKWINNFATNLSFFAILTIPLAIPIKTLKYAPNPLFLIPLSAIAIICVSKNSSFSTKILSFKALVYIGLSSYSIYLYHQPLLAFVRLRTINEIKAQTAIILVIGAFLIGFVMYELIEKKKIFNLLGKISLVLQGAKSLLIFAIILGLINITLDINNGFFSLRFPYLLINEKPPLGFLGGKGYVDYPNVYQSNEFLMNKRESEEENKARTFKVFLEGNSKTRDLINSLEIIDDMNPQLRFDYSYNNPGKGKANKDLLDKADLVIIQIDNSDNNNTISKMVLGEYEKYSDKLLWHKSRERFAKNITPIIFIKNQEERRNFKYSSIDSYHCEKEDILSNKFEPKNSGLGILDTQCAFNDRDGFKIFTSSEGELFSFDGVNLTFAGAKELAQNLINSQKFKKIFGLEYFKKI